jgi:hypothetical protein
LNGCHRLADCFAVVGEDHDDDEHDNIDDDEGCSKPTSQDTNNSIKHNSEKQIEEKVSKARLRK